MASRFTVGGGSMRAFHMSARPPIVSNSAAQSLHHGEIRCEIGGRGFAVHRLGQGELYHVRVGAPEDTSCECMGFLRWGKCKHTAALAALIRKGDL